MNRKRSRPYPAQTHISGVFSLTPSVCFFPLPSHILLNFFETYKENEKNEVANSFCLILAGSFPETPNLPTARDSWRTTLASSDCTLSHSTLSPTAQQARNLLTSLSQHLRCPLSACCPQRQGVSNLPCNLRVGFNETHPSF